MLNPTFVEVIELISEDIPLELKGLKQYSGAENSFQCSITLHS